MPAWGEGQNGHIGGGRVGGGLNWKCHRVVVG